MSNDQDDDTSTNYTIMTLAESISVEHKENLKYNENVEPKPGSKVIIRHVQSREVIMLSGGNIILASRDAHGSDEWECIEHSEGWLWFRHTIAGTFLGYGEDWNLCVGKKFSTWEKFRIHKREDGGLVLIMHHIWYGKNPVAVKEEDEVKKLAMVRSWEAPEAVWEFIET